MQLNIKDSLSKVKIYGRYLSEFLLPDQVDILAKSLQKALTHNRCDSCGFTKEQVYVTEHFTESGWIECKPCYNNRSNSNCA